MLNMVGLLFGCSHKRHTFPITLRKRNRQSSDAEVIANMTYVVCLNCGEEFPYDWQQMKVVTTPKQTRKGGTVVPGHFSAVVQSGEQHG